MLSQSLLKRVAISYLQKWPGVLSKGPAQISPRWPRKFCPRSHPVPYNVDNEHRQPNRLCKSGGNSRTNSTQAARLDEEPIEERVEQCGCSRCHSNWSCDALCL